MQYSKDFRAIISNPNNIRTSETDVGSDFTLFSASRIYVSTLIEFPGTIIDIGCSNGLMLRCLQEWSGKEMIPYGIDWHKQSIDETSNLFPGLTGHFAHLDIMPVLEDIPGSLKQLGFPVKFDYVYFVNWGYCSTEDTARIVRGLLHCTNRRLIISFYKPAPLITDTNAHRISEIKKAFTFSGQTSNSYGNQSLWIDV